MAASARKAVIRMLFACISLAIKIKKSACTVAFAKLKKKKRKYHVE